MCIVLTQSLILLIAMEVIFRLILEHQIGQGLSELSFLNCVTLQRLG